jgi:hypothetical protein
MFFVTFKRNIRRLMKNKDKSFVVDFELRLLWELNTKTLTARFTDIRYSHMSVPNEVDL